jgi:hypothetical protein
MVRIRLGGGRPHFTRARGLAARPDTAFGTGGGGLDPLHCGMGNEFIAMLHYSRERAAWLQLTGWASPATHRDALAALREIERQTDEVVRERGEPEHTPFVLLAGSIASDDAPHRVRKTWRLAPELADRLLVSVDERGVEEAIEASLAEWDDARAEGGDAVDSLDADDWVGVDLDALAARAYPGAH